MSGRATAIAVIVLAGCSSRDRDPAPVARSGSAVPSPAAPVEVWPRVSEPHLPPAPWPEAGGAWAVGVIGGKPEANPDLFLGDRPTIPTRRIVERGGLTFTFGGDVNYTLYFVRVVLPGAAAKHAAARAWFGLPDQDPIPAASADSHLEVTFHGDEVEIRRWANRFPRPEVDMRSILPAIAALDDEIESRGDQHVFTWFDYDRENPRDLTLELISWDHCGTDGDTWIGRFRDESPTSARRRVLKAMGFRRVVCRWVRIFQTYEFP